MKKLFGLLVVLLMYPFFTHGDVAIEGQVGVKFKIINLAEFPDFMFFYDYQTFFYNQGYQPGEVMPA